MSGHLGLRINLYRIQTIQAAAPQQMLTSRCDAASAMKAFVALAALLPLVLRAHDLPSTDKEALRAHLLEEYLQQHPGKPMTRLKARPAPQALPKTLRRPVNVAAASAFDFTALLGAAAALPPSGNGLLMAASFAPFKPKVRFNWDSSTFFLESDNMPEGMPNRMFGITTWQQQVPIAAAYFAHSISNENDAASLGYQQPNVWRIPLVPVPSASPITIYNPPAPPTNFLRGAVALASNGVAIFNPSNNGGNVSYEIGELDIYGGHCGLADDYHYHIVPTHLYSRFGGPLGDDKPAAWALDGYPIYGFVEPDGSARQGLDNEGGHDHGNGWGYHYHAVGNTSVDATHPFGTPQSPYLMKAFHGTVVNYGNQVDGQPAVGNLRGDGTGGYNAKAVAGAYIVAMMNPAPLTTDGNGHLNLVSGVSLTNCVTTYGSSTVSCSSTASLTVGHAVVGYGVANNARIKTILSGNSFELSQPALASSSGRSFSVVPMTTASADAWLMRVNMGGVDYDECWTLNRKALPRSLTMTWRAQALIGGALGGPVLTTTQTYTPTAGSASGNRITAYPMAAWSEVKLPDTSQAISSTNTFGEDSDYATAPQANPQSFTDNGNGTITDNVTGLMWQKLDAGEMTWENAVTNAASQTTGGYSDWRLPNPHELMSLFNYEAGNPAMNSTYFPLNGLGAEYWWSRDSFGISTSNVWAVNAGGGVGPKPKSETISAGGSLRYHARYVRLAQANMTHNYINHLDGTVTDTDTALMWTQMPGSAMTWEAALSWAENLSAGGYSDWRLPNIKELQTLTDYALASSSSASANLKPALNRTLFAKTMSPCGLTSGSAVITTNDTSDLAVGMTVVDPFSVAGAYIDHATAPYITAINPNISFTLSTAAKATKSNLILRALPRATAYWSSTSNKGTPTEAWLLEMGVNTSVPANEGPNRGAQGIISYQAKTASFPAFAVRSATLTTSLSVTLAGNTLTDSLGTVSFGNVDVGSTQSKTFTITNTGSTTLNISGLSLDGTGGNSFAVVTTPAATLAAGASSDFSLSFTPQSFGNKVAALHIASDDAGNPSFDINLAGSGYIAPPTISQVGLNPISPTSSDSANITARISPGAFGSISSVSLQYDFGPQVTADVFRETFAMTASNNWAGSGALNAWSTSGAGATRQANFGSNRSAPITLSNCGTVEGSNTVTCGSTANLWPGMILIGPGLAANCSIASIGSGTTLQLNAPATATSNSATLTANGLSLTNCTTSAGSNTVSCDSTLGLVVGMSLSGTGLANNATVSSITSGSSFLMSANPLTPGTGLTLTVSGNALEFQGASASLSTATATSPAINATGSAGFVEFYVQTRDLNSLLPNNQWTFQVSPDGGTTWNTRLTEDWSGSSLSLNNVVTNAAGNAGGSSTVTCASTVGLSVGRSVSSLPVYVTGNTTAGSAIVTSTTTGNLKVGMFVTSTGTTLPAAVRILSIDSASQFTMTANAGANGTAINIAATVFAGNATVASITNSTSFTLSAAAYADTSAAPISAFASSLNHGFTTKADGGSQPYRYALDASERSANLKLRFQYAGGTVTQPTRAPRVSIDDIVVNSTQGLAPVTLAMFDDGQHGDGAANDGVWGASIPPQADGATLYYRIIANDALAGASTSSNASFTVAPAPTISTTSPLPAGSTLTAYSQTLSASGGSGSGYVWSLVSGALPAGLSLSSSGLLNGTATAAGNFNFSVEVTDSAGRSAIKPMTLSISAQTAPNIVVIITDDQGWGDVGYHSPPGQVPIQTPTMDSFGTSRAGSIRLERFYATTVCSVTRSTFLTGRNAIRHATNNERGTDLSEHLLPQTLKSAGYQTYLCGKWHMGGSDKNTSYLSVNGVNTRIIKEGLQYAPYNRGFDSHYGQYSGAIDYFTHMSAEAEVPDKPDWWLNGVQQDGPSEHTDSQNTGGWSPNLLADKAISHIQNRDPSKPMYLHLAFNSIHGPVSAPPALITKYQNLGVTNTNRRLISAAVDGMDQAMGRVLAALDAAGITNNTLVIWFGDNGGDEIKGSLNDPLRGDKGDSYDGGLREVAGISWPGVLPEGGVISHQYVWVGDLFPTICAATGVTPQNSKPLDGVNLWPNLLTATSSNSTTERPGNAPLITDTAAPIAIKKFIDPVGGGSKDFKLRRSRVGNSTVTELFNLSTDEYETTDLSGIAAYASIVTELTNSITAISPDNNKPYIGPALITASVPAGGGIELYAPFTSYKAPTVQWRKNGVNIPGATSFTQVTDTLGTLVSGSYTTKLMISNASAADAATYDVMVSNVGGSSSSASGVLSVTSAAPQLNLPVFSKGSTATLTWAAVPGAVNYSIERSSTSDFSVVTETLTSSVTSVTFTNLAAGSSHYYRARAGDGSSFGAAGAVVSSTQDAASPILLITSPANAITVTSGSITLRGSAVDALSGISSVTVNGVAAASANGFADWSLTLPLVPGLNTLTATATDGASPDGNSSQTSISLTYRADGPNISAVSVTPTVPNFLDPTRILAQVAPAPGGSVASVRVDYDSGTPLSLPVLRETFTNTSSNNWNGSAALNAWTTVGAGNVRQAVAQSNRTAAIAISNASTTAGSSTVTCASTAGLWPGMLITGPNIPGSINGSNTGNTTVASVSNATSFVLSQSATASGSGLNLTACGVTLSNATTSAASVVVTCDSTAGLISGMALSGTGLAGNATVASVSSATSFSMNVAPTTPGSGLTLAASGAAAEFNGGTANLSESMLTTTNAINTTGAAGFVEFYVQTRDLFANNNCGWAFQVSSDNGATWNTRLSEDWTSKTVNLSAVITNAGAASAGSTSVTCADTSALSAGRSLLMAPINVTLGLTLGSSTATCSNTTGLLPGMFISATGIPNNTRIGSITPNVSLTLVTGNPGTAVSATASNASAAAAASCFASGTTISSITNATTFVISTAAYANTASASFAAYATTINHGFTLFHYDLVGAELGPQTKIRFQATGYSAVAPTRSPRISIDDLVVATTAPPPTLSITLFDDGLHGDGAANDGLWGGSIPALPGGTSVSFKVIATGGDGSSSTNPASGVYGYVVNATLTDATVSRAEFLGIPTSSGITLNLVFASDQEVYVEYGTVAGRFDQSTPPAIFPAAAGPVEISLSGLNADCDYFYRLRHRAAGTQAAFAARPERRFHTARPANRPFTFTITADPHLDEATDVDLFKTTMANIRADQPDLHIDLGDIFMTDKLATTRADLGGGLINAERVMLRASMLRSLFEETCHSVPFFYTSGNHEAEYGYLFAAAADKQNNIPAWNLRARKALYPTPVPSAFYGGNSTPLDYNGGSLGLLENYYAWQWGDALFIVLDPFWNTMANPTSAAGGNWNWSLGKAQYDWLAQTLRNSSAKFRFVFTHHLVGGTDSARGGTEVARRYEWGGRNADDSAGFALNRPGWEKPIHDLLKEHGVQAVFHGHDHLYGYQTLDGIVYLECPQPGTPNFTSLGSAADGQYSDGVLLPNSGHIRVEVGVEQAVCSYVRAYRSSDENFTRHNRDIGHSFTMAALPMAILELRDDSGVILGTGDTLDFGNVTTGRPATMNLKVHNTGNLELSLSAIQCSGPWLCGLNSGTLPAGGSLDLSLTLTALASGALQGTLALVSNDFLNPAFSVNLAAHAGAAQSLSFAPIGMQDAGALLTPSATASSGLPVSFTVTQGADLVQWEGGALRLNKSGSVTLRAVQAGNAEYGAVSASQSFLVRRLSSELRLDPPPPASAWWQSSVMLETRSAQHGGTVSLQVTSGPGLLQGNRLSFTGKGNVMLRAFLPATDVYDAGLVEFSIVARDAVALNAINGGFSGRVNDQLKGRVSFSNLAGLEEPVTVEFLGLPSHGRVSWVGSAGDFLYQPDPGFEGEDRFTFCARQLGEASNVAEVLLLIRSRLADWTWQGGQAGANAKAVLSPVNGDDRSPCPGARAASVHWSDNDGRRMLFGGWGYGGNSGPGLLADLWCQDPITARWLLLKEPTEINASRVVGEVGVERSGQSPGGRSEACWWIGSDGALWLFGGQGLDSHGKPALMADLWRLNLTTLLWTCIKDGSPNQNGSAAAPGARSAAACWRDDQGRFLMFGGRGLGTSGSSVGALSDLWAFDPSSGHWSAVGGSRDLNAGTIMDGSTAWPAARSHAALWKDSQRGILLFAGAGTNSSPLNDLWCYQPFLNRWVILRAASARPQTSMIGEMGQAGEGDWPGSRSAATFWSDAAGNHWLIGGYGLGSAGAGALGDVWCLQRESLQWACMKGPLSAGSLPAPGRLGEASDATSPGARSQSMAWSANDGDVWLYGGRNASRLYGENWSLDLPALPQLSQTQARVAAPMDQGQVSLELSTRVQTQGQACRVWWRIGRQPDLKDAVESSSDSLTGTQSSVTSSLLVNQSAATWFYLQACCENAAGVAFSPILSLGTESGLNPARVQWEQTTSSIDEAQILDGTPEAGVLRVTLQLDRPAAGIIIVPIALQGEAIEGRDYIPPAAEVSFLNGQTQSWFELRLKDDGIQEARESLQITLGEPSGPAALGAVTTHQVFIEDNDVAPQIQIQPRSQFAKIGGPAITLDYALSAGTEPFSHQWSKKGLALPAARGAALTLPAISASAGFYELTISNATGSDSSTRAHLVMLQPLPALVSAKLGGSVALKQIAFGSGLPLSYQWYRKIGLSDVPLSPAEYSGADSATLSLSNLSVEHSGEYFCRVSNETGQGECHAVLQVAGVAPEILPPTLPQGFIGEVYQFQLQLKDPINGGSGSFAASGLPTGLSLTAGGMITGRPTSTAVNKTVVFTARNSLGNGKSISAEIDIDAMPTNIPGTYLSLGSLEGEAMRLDVTLNTSAALSLKITSDDGSISARALGVYDSAKDQLSASCLIKPPGRFAPLLLELTMSGDHLSGRWVQPLNFQVLGGFSGYRQVWNTTRSPRNQSGYHNLLLQPPAELRGDLDLPQGTGYAAFTISATNGGLSLSSRDALGVSYTGSSFLGPEGQVAVVCHNSSNASTLFGVLNLRASPASIQDPNPVVGNLQWSKAAIASLSHRTYRRGFETLDLEAVGGRYRAPPIGTIFMNLPRSAQNNARLLFSQGGLLPGEFALRFDNPVGSLQKVTTPSALKLVFSPSTGLFSGSFSTTQSGPTRLVNFSAMAVPDALSWRAAGHFLVPDLPQPGQTLLSSPVLSGLIQMLPLEP